MFLLDINIISELRKPRPHGAVIQWSEAYAESAYRVPSIAIYELQAGAEATRLQDRGRAEELERWIERIIATQTIIAFDEKTARETARFMVGTPLDLFEDAAIAATAKVNGLTVATRNTRDFERFHVPLVNPFLYKG